MCYSQQHTNHSDLELWSLFVKGNKNVLEVLYKRHYDTLLNYGLKYGVSKSVVEDSIHDLFVKLYLSKNISNTPHVVAYLIRSLKNTLLDTIKEKKNIQFTDNIDFDIEIEDATLQQLFIQNDAQLHLSKKLASSFSELSAKQKQILYLRFIKNLSHKEISYILEVNEQSAMNALSRVLSKLRKIITFF